VAVTPFCFVTKELLELRKCLLSNILIGKNECVVKRNMEQVFYTSNCIGLNCFNIHTLSEKVYFMLTKKERLHLLSSILHKHIILSMIP